MLRTQALYRESRIKRVYFIFIVCSFPTIMCSVLMCIKSVMSVWQREKENYNKSRGTPLIHAGIRLDVGIFSANLNYPCPLPPLFPASLSASTSTPHDEWTVGLNIFKEHLNVSQFFSATLVEHRICCGKHHTASLRDYSD